MAVQSQQDSAYGKREATGGEANLIRLIGGLLILLGAGAILTLILSVANNPEFAEGGSPILVFLDVFGIIIPALTIGLGLYFVRLGVQLFSKDYQTAGWSQFVLFWLAIILVFYAGWRIYTGTLPGEGAGEQEAIGIPWLVVLGSLVVAAVSGAAWYWLDNNKDEIFVGGDTLATRDARLAWTLLLPTVAVLVLVAARPLERTFIASLTDEELAGTGEIEFIGFQNYAELLSFRIDRLDCERNEDGSCVIDDGEIDFPNPRAVIGDDYRGYRGTLELTIGESQWVLGARDDDFFESFQNTIFYTVVAVTLEFVLGMIVALAVNTKFPGRGAMRAAMLVPWAIPTVVSARLWEVMLRDNRSGVINDMLIRAGIMNDPIAWLANPDSQIWSLIFVDVWKTTPFFALLLLAGLQTIPGEIYEAAQVDGASKVRRFFNITLPLLRPTIAVALIFRTLDSLRAFDVFDVLVGRQLQSMSTYTQFQLVENQAFGYASAVGVFIFILILIFTVIYVRIFGIDEEEA